MTAKKKQIGEAIAAASWEGVRPLEKLDIVGGARIDGTGAMFVGEEEKEEGVVEEVPDGFILRSVVVERGVVDDDSEGERRRDWVEGVAARVADEGFVETGAEEKDGAATEAAAALPRVS